MSPLRLAWLNLSRRALPTLIALLAIALSVACSGILLRLNLLAQDRFDRLSDGGDAIVGAKAGGVEIILNALGGEGEFPEFLPYKLFESLKAERTVQFEDGVKERPSYLRGIYPFVYFGQLDGARAVGTDATLFTRPGKQLEFMEGQAFAKPRELVVGHDVFTRHHWKLGDRVLISPWSGEVSEELVEFTVVGHLKPNRSNWDRVLFASVADAQGVLNQTDLRARSIWGPSVLHYFLVDLEPDGFRSLDQLVNRRTVAEAVSVRREVERLRDLTGTGKTLGWLMTALVLALGALSVTAMLMTRFEAMGLQLAVLRAIGYSRRVIGRWLLWEGFLLGVGASFVGAVVDALAFPWVRSALGSALPAVDLIPSSIWSSGPVWISAVVATVLSVFVPLWRVYRQDIGLSLRS